MPGIWHRRTVLSLFLQAASPPGSKLPGLAPEGMTAYLFQGSVPCWLVSPAATHEKYKNLKKEVEML